MAKIEVAKNTSEGVKILYTNTSGGRIALETDSPYIASLSMSAFVMDYTHNDMSNPEFQQRHAEFYRVIREKNTQLPIIIMTSPYSTSFLDLSKWQMRSSRF